MPFNPLQPAVCIALHGVAPQNTAGCLRWLRAIDAIGNLPLTLSLVPERGWQPAAVHQRFEAMLEQCLERGDELALHGDAPLAHAVTERNWFSKALNLVSAQKPQGSAFTAGLARATETMEQGLEWFSRRGWPIHGCIVPAWMMNGPGWKTLKKFGFRYAETRRRFLLLPQRLAVPAQSSFYGVRRALGTQARGDAMLPNPAWEHAPLVRLSLNAAAAEYADVVVQFQRFMERLLVARKGMTKAGFAHYWTHRQQAIPERRHTLMMQLH